MSEKVWKFFKWILIIGSGLAALKLIFVDFTLDEEYQIVLAYRNLSGDSLFVEMWEPSQSSAFFCAAFMWLWHLIFKTYTGVVLFLRVISLFIQVGLSLAVYKTALRITDDKKAFVGALIYFNIVPKVIQIPDFSNMQLWFLTGCILLLMYSFYDENNVFGCSSLNKRKVLAVIGAGICLSMEILTYPTCLILFPVMLVYIVIYNRKKLLAALIFSGTCVICGVIWLAIVVGNAGFEVFIGNIFNMLNSDMTHTVKGATSAKLGNIADNMLLWCKTFIPTVLAGVVLTLVTALIRRILTSRKGEKKGLNSKQFLCCAVCCSSLVALAVQMYCWTVLKIGFEYLQLHILTVMIGAFVTVHIIKEVRREIGFILVSTCVAYLAVMYITDLAPFYTLPHGSLGICFAVIAIAEAFGKVFSNNEACAGAINQYSVILKERNVNNISNTLGILFMIVFCFVSIWGKGFTLRASKPANTIFNIGGIMRNGPCVGIFADYMNAHIYDADLKDYKENIQAGSKVLIVANMVMSSSTIQYVANELEVCHYSIIDPTFYDEKLCRYWELYPDKKPDVIVVDCWYGELKEDKDSFIMKYIENDFGYSRVVDGEYVRFYIR